MAISKKSVGHTNDIEKRNPMVGKKVVFIANENDIENADGVKGHLEAIGVSNYISGIYDRYVKRMIDIVLSFFGLIVLSPVFVGIGLAIKLDDPGPVFFKQRRIGKNKEYFMLHKFRSMKMATPHDIPTHMLENPEGYITKVGGFLRKHSLDELPQIWDIFIGNMSIIGPRPALWNQDVLVAERDKYNANDIKPGLTGWAQINGRDELKISEKARLDGEYVQKESFFFDLKCFLGTVSKIAKDDSVVEGGTGENFREMCCFTEEKTDEELIGRVGFGMPVNVNYNRKKRILITGAGSYIGKCFLDYAKENYDKNLHVDELDMLNDSWREIDFSIYDTVYHVAGIAHADVGHVSEIVKHKYYDVNTNLALEVCQKAKNENVREFIFMSSMIIYGDSAPVGKNKKITEKTVPCPSNFYGDSKLQADVAVRDLANENFKVFVLRPPMIYGKGSKGNYPILAKLAKKISVFPNVENERSMLHVDNLCEFLCQIILAEGYTENAMVFFPQNADWVRTSDMVKEIAGVYEKKIKLLKCLNLFVKWGSVFPGKVGTLVNKAFGNSCYEKSLSQYKGINYQIVELKESIIRTENP